MSSIDYIRKKANLLKEILRIINYLVMISNKIEENKDFLLKAYSQNYRQRHPKKRISSVRREVKSAVSKFTNRLLTLVPQSMKDKIVESADSSKEQINVSPLEFSKRVTIKKE